MAGTRYGIFYFCIEVLTLPWVLMHSMKSRQAVGMLNPKRYESEGTYRSREGTTPKTSACPEAGK